MNTVNLGKECGFHFNSNDGEFFFTNLTFYDNWNETLTFDDAELCVMDNIMMLNETTTIKTSNISLIVQSFNESYLQDLTLHPGSKFANQSTKSIDYHIYYTHDWNQTFSQMDIDIYNLPFDFFGNHNMSTGMIDQFFENFSETFKGLNHSSVFEPMETDYVALMTYLDMSFNGMKTPGKLELIYDNFHNTTPYLVYFTWKVPGLDNARSSCSLKLLKEFQKTFF